MFEDKDSAGSQQPLPQHKVGNQGQFFQGVWWVGEDEVELLLTTSDKAEDVAPQRYAGLSVQLPHAVADETVVVAVLFDADHMAAAA